MHEADLAGGLAALKREFARTFVGESQIREAVPAGPTEGIPIGAHELEALHWFAARNPIYHSSSEVTVGGTPCIVYEGDINRYWLGSIGHGPKSRAPFSPTWMLSAYACARLAVEHGFEQAVDVGSGDGRIAFCASMLGLRSYSIEIDRALADLQGRLLSSARLSGAQSPQVVRVAASNMDPRCADAASFDYGSLDLSRPVFFIGGLAQMGGAALASEIMGGIRACPGIGGRAGWVFPGTDSAKYAPDPAGMSGWGTVVRQNGLRHVRTVGLPTAWTFGGHAGGGGGGGGGAGGGQGQEDLTPYVFCAESPDANSNPN